ncbi:MAG: hypothetical protein A2Y02_03570 [Omnitrophica bacterium GWA2_52_12]|nr:MAG: hypothetical protein A2Y02_03570 [Omnitrophica bacterium GWA2_52_12]
MKLSKNRKYAVLSIWLLLLLLLALVPEHLCALFLREEHNSVYAHTAAYACLGLAAASFFRSMKRIGEMRLSDWHCALLAVLVAGIYGGATEICQYLTQDRQPDWADLNSDLQGIIPAALFFLLVRSSFLKTKWRPVKLRLLKGPLWARTSRA